MLARYIYRHSRYFTLFIVCVIAVGITSFRSIARQEDPSLTNFVGSITAFYPGASPDRVEALVTRPLEQELRKIPEIDELWSTSASGVSQTTIRLFDTLPAEAMELAWSEIRDAMTEAARQFPTGAGEPDFDNDRMSSFTAIVALSAQGTDDIPLPLLGRLAADFADRAKRGAGSGRWWCSTRPGASPVWPPCSPRTRRPWWPAGSACNRWPPRCRPRMPKSPPVAPPGRAPIC